ncbi:dihydrolipoyl dehydrogenase [Methylocystis iwaonis]|uniref:dihydrolipoyl dehydrogenase n=1 Tax=Methylocystis iwaonis TaxID=2885079 RepID=UPI002E7C348A|nr:dihydrolipoyl dehydrogenase [Methylocystis iwaonis]
MSQSYDVIVIGGGPGGYVAAIRAAQLGLKTAVVEREHLGGICLNWGCIPTKALLRSAEVYRLAQDGARYGVTVTEPGFDAARIVARSREAAGRLNAGVGFLLKKNKVDVIWGEARLESKGELQVGAPTKPAVTPQLPAPKTPLGEGAYQAKHIIVATGARPRVLPGLEPDGRLVWTYFDALKPERFPKSLLVVGAGAIGVEFASFYRTFGVEVTLVEALPQILAAEDAEIAAFARKSFEKQGIVIETATTVAGLEKKTDSVVVTLKGADGGTRTLEVERALSAAGVVANVENLGLEALGVALERGVIKTDGLGRTNVPGVYAIGDVAGGPMLAHKAEHEGVLCVEAIAGLPAHPLDKSLVPGCTYCHPQVASVGLTEEKAKAAGDEVRVGRFPYLGNGKAIALGEPEGLVKTIFDAKTGRLLGAHLVGAEATELIQGFVIAMNLETTEEELMQTIFPHPTLSETMHESVLNAFGRAIHI